jgi:hypothetical protein
VGGAVNAGTAGGLGVTRGGSRRALLFTLLALVGLFSLTAIAFQAMSWSAPRPSGMFGPRGSSTVAGLVYTAVGGIVAARRPSNPIGWLCLAVGLITAILGLAEGYAFWGLVERGGRPVLSIWAGWVVEWAFILWILGMGLIVALFPNGRWRSPRWKVAILIACAASVVGMVATALEPTFTVFAGFDNPIGISGGVGTALVQAGSGVVWIFTLVVLVGGVGSAAARFRDAAGDERQQLKWLAFSSSGLLLALTAFGVVTLANGALGTNPGGYDWLEDLGMAGVIALPIGIAIAVLKYRLYDIDRIISRSLGYALLTVLLVGVYAAVVLGIGSALGRTDSPILIACATLLVAALFRPARRRIQSAIDRRFHRRRYDADRALAGFSTTLRGQGDLDELRRRMVHLVVETMEPETVTVWFRGTPRG